jgi:hypothetical protein
MQTSKVVHAASGVLLGTLGVTLLASSYIMHNSEGTVLVSTRDAASSKKGRFLSSRDANNDLSHYFQSQAAVEKNKHELATKHGESAHDAQNELSSYFARQALRAEGKVPVAHHQKGKITLVEDDHDSYPAPRPQGMAENGPEYGMSAGASRKDLRHYFAAATASKHGHSRSAHIAAAAGFTAHQADQQINGDYSIYQVTCVICYTLLTTAYITQSTQRV